MLESGNRKRIKKKIYELQRQGDTLCQGYDIANAKKAGVIGCIQAEKRDIRDFKRETETGVVI